MTPFILIETDGGRVSDVTTFGYTGTAAFVIEWEHVKDDGDAEDLIQDILSLYDDDSQPDSVVQGILDRLKDIVDENTEDEDEPCPDCGDSNCFGECLEDEEIDDEDEDDEDEGDLGNLGEYSTDAAEGDEKKEEDYNGNEFNDGPATPLDARD